MIHRLRRRFIAIAMTSVTLVMCLMALSMNVFNFLSTDGALSDTLRVIYENQGSIPPPPEGGPDGPPGGRFTQETPYSTRYFILAYRGDGTLELADMRHIAAVTEEDADTYLSIALAHGEGMGYTEEYKYCVIHTGEDRYVAIFLDCQQELYSVRTFAWISLLVVAVCVILVYILIWLFSKKAIEPTVKSVEKQKQFITDASHELKTPLTVITTSLKVLEMEIGGQKWIDKARGQAEKMAELVDSLVTLARLDEERQPLRYSRFDISSAVEDAAEGFRDFAAAQGHEMVLDIAPALTYYGDEYAVRQLVSILLDDAVKYADSGGGILLSLKGERRGVVLRTSNPCSGMDPAELDRLFDHFYRPDRSRSKRTGGYGIGLSIAKGIAEAHRGAIRAELPAEGEICFIVTLR